MSAAAREAHPKGTQAILRSANAAMPAPRRRAKEPASVKSTSGLAQSRLDAKSPLTQRPASEAAPRPAARAAAARGDRAPRPSVRRRWARPAGGGTRPERGSRGTGQDRRTIRATGAPERAPARIANAARLTFAAVGSRWGASLPVTAPCCLQAVDDAQRSKPAGGNAGTGPWYGCALPPHEPTDYTLALPHPLLAAAAALALPAARAGVGAWDRAAPDFTP